MALTPNLPPSQLAVTAVESSQALDAGTRKIWLTNTNATETAYFALETGVLTTTGFPVLPEQTLGPLGVEPNTGLTLFLIGSGALTLGLLEEG